ncbi:MAG TPA: hypothetical protein VJ801_15580 [Polyangia bacterium]|nr:hypothetical protein [Polyangia bacterium]
MSRLLGRVLLWWWRRQDAAAAARSGCERAGQREESWYGGEQSREPLLVLDARSKRLKPRSEVRWPDNVIQGRQIL